MIQWWMLTYGAWIPCSAIAAAKHVCRFDKENYNWSRGEVFLGTEEELREFYPTIEHHSDWAKARVFG